MSTTVSERLRSLRLGAMADAWERQEARLDQRSAVARLTELLDAQEGFRADTMLTTGLRRAAVPISSARLADANCERGRGLTLAMVEGLQGWSWLRAQRNLVLMGATGRGKTWLASALTNEAVRAGFRVRYFDVRTFLQEWYDHEARHELARFLSDLSRTELLVLDRWAAHPLEPHGVARLEELVMAREGKTSLVVCSTEAPETWAAWLGGGAVAEGIVDRLVCRANVVGLKGPSLRGKQSKPLP